MASASLSQWLAANIPFAREKFRQLLHRRRKRELPQILDQLRVRLAELRAEAETAYAQMGSERDPAPSPAAPAAPGVFQAVDYSIGAKELNAIQKPDIRARFATSLGGSDTREESAVSSQVANLHPFATLFTSPDETKAGRERE